MGKHGQERDPQATIDSLQVQIEAAYTAGDWGRALDLGNRLEALLEQADEELALSAAQGYWDSMTQSERDIYQKRPGSTDDFRRLAGETMFGHEEDNPDNETSLTE